MDQRNRKEKSLSIAVLSQDGDFLREVTYQVASTMLSASVAKLLLQKPIAIQLTTTDDNVRYAIRKKGKKNKVQSSDLYGNIKFLSPEGEVMFHHGIRRALWYLCRDLADVVQLEPLIVRLKFKPNGDGHFGDAYYQTHKENICVVCGKKDELNRHHVVPYSYKKYFPEELKNHSHHDVLLLCLDCHDSYERYADILKKQLAEKYDAPIGGKGRYIDRYLLHVYKAARTLLSKEEELPQSRLEELLNVIREYIDRQEVTEDDIILCTCINFEFTSNYKKHGEIVVSQLNDLDELQEFVQQWREHFLNSMNPRFMPEHWCVNRPVEKR